MADTTPDSSHKDMISVVIRCPNEDCIPEEFLLKIEESPDKSGLGTAKQIFQIMTAKGLDIDCLAFQSYDFASNMSGIHNGCQENLSQLVERNIPYIHCQDHRTNTALEHSCSESLIFSDLFNILEKIYTFFSGSTKRFRKYANRVRDIENSLQLKGISKTRWTARADSIKAVNIAYEQIKELLAEMSADMKLDLNTRNLAFGLYKKVFSFDFIITLFFMKNVVSKIRILTLELETPKSNIIDSIIIIESLIEILESMKEDYEGVEMGSSGHETRNPMNDEIDAAIAFAERLKLNPEQEFNKHHRLRKPPKRLDENAENAHQMAMKEFYRKEFLQFLNRLCTDLTDNVKAIKANVAPLYKLFSFPLDNKNIKAELVEEAISLFPEKHRPDSQLLQNELKVFFIWLKKNEALLSDESAENNTTEDRNIDSMAKVLKAAAKIKEQLPVCFKLCQLIAAAGYGVASNERTFSVLKFVKNDLRSTMGDDRLDDLMQLKCHRELADTLDLTKVCKTWAELKERRLK